MQEHDNPSAPDVEEEEEEEEEEFYMLQPANKSDRMCHLVAMMMHALDSCQKRQPTALVM